MQIQKPGAHIPLKKVKLRNGETLAYREASTNPKTSKILILLHGAFSSSAPFLAHIPPLAETFRVIALDLRGHGQSSYVNTLNSIDDFVEDLKDFTDILKIKKFSIMGWSAGGGVAMKFAAKYPDRVEKLILYASIGVRGSPMFKLDEKGFVTQERLLTREEVLKHPITQMLNKVMKNKDTGTAKLFMNTALFNAKGKPTPELLETIADAFISCKCNGDVQYALNMYNINYESNGESEGSNLVSKIKCRVLILHGEKDRVIPVREARVTKDYFKDQAVLKTFSEAGHALIEDNPQEVISLIKRFLTEDNVLKLSKL